MLRFLKPVAIACLMLTTFCANATTIAVTTADSLNVRSSPNGEVIDSLPAGSVVALQRVSGGWAYVLYLDESKRPGSGVGWVSAQFLRVASEGTGLSATGDDCRKERKSGAKVCLEVTSADFDCDEHYSGEYYDSCEIEVDYEIRSDYKGDSRIYVDIECEARVSYKTRESYDSSDSDSESESHYLRANRTIRDSLELDFSYSDYQEVYSAEVDSLECEIESVSLR